MGIAETGRLKDCSPSPSAISATGQKQSGEKFPTRGPKRFGNLDRFCRLSDTATHPGDGNRAVRLAALVGDDGGSIKTTKERFAKDKVSTSPVCLVKPPRKNSPDLNNLVPSKDLRHAGRGRHGEAKRRAVILITSATVTVL